MSPIARLSLILSAAILVAGVAFFAVVATMTTPSGRGGDAGASALGAPFELVDQDGRPQTEAILRGRPTLLFFGFTHCPDICPTKLLEIATILQELGPDARRLNVVFVSVDPERDTPELLKAYVESFDPAIRALTGPPERIAALARAWRAYVRRVPLEGGGYTIDHTTAVYLLDSAGRFVSTFDTGQGATRAAAALRRIIAG